MAYPTPQPSGSQPSPQPGPQPSPASGSSWGQTGSAFGQIAGQTQQYVSNYGGFGPQPNWQQLLGWIQQQQNDPNQRYRNDLARIGLTEQALGIDRAALQRQYPYLSDLHDITQRGIGLEATRLKDVHGARLDLGERQLDRADKEARVSHYRASQDLMGQMAALGATHTTGTSRRLMDLSHQLSNELVKIGFAREGIAIDRRDLEIKGEELRLASREERLKYKERVAQVDDALKKLDLKGRELGLQRGEAAKALNDAIHQNNLQSVLSVYDMFVAWTSGSVQQQQQAGAIISWLLGQGKQGAQPQQPQR